MLRRKCCLLLAMLMLCMTLLGGCCVSADPLGQLAADGARHLLRSALDGIPAPTASPAPRQALRRTGDEFALVHEPEQTEVAAQAHAAPTAVPTAAPVPDALAEVSPDAAFVQEEDLFLYLADNTFTVDWLETMQLTLRFGEEAQGPITVVDETGNTLLTAENDGSGLLRLSTLFYGETAKTGSLTAHCGDLTSNAVSYHVVPEITEAMFGELTDAADGLIAFLTANPPADPYSEDALAAVESFLAQCESVHSVSRCGDVLFYSTNDGLTGSYGLGRETEGYAGFAQPGQTFEAWQRGEDLSDTVLMSRAPLTNDNCLLLTPQGSDDTMSERLNNGFLILEDTPLQVDPQQDAQAVSTLQSGDFVDCGLLVLNAHGSLAPRADGTSQLFFCIGTHEDAAMRTLIGAENGSGYGVFWTEFDNKTEHCRATLDVSIVDGVAMATVRLSTLFLESAIGERTFDNTVILFCVCHGFCDVRLQELFLNHGAAAFIGGDISFPAGYTDLILCEMRDAFSEVDESGAPISLLEAVDRVSMITVDQFAQLAHSPDRADFDSAVYEDALSKTTQTYETVSGGNHMRYIDRAATDIVPAGEGSVYGVVQTPDETPIAGAEVTLYRWLNHAFTPLAPEDSTPVTNNRGEYIFNGVPFGLYIAEAVKGESRAYVLVEHVEKEMIAEPIVLNASVVLAAQTHVSRPLAYPYVGVAAQPELLCGGTSEEAFDAINRELETMYDNVSASFAAYADLADDPTDDPDVTYTNTFVLKNVYSTAGLLALSGHYSEICSDAAHSVSYSYGLTLDLTTGAPLSLPAMLEGDNPNAAAQLAAQIESQLDALDHSLDDSASAIAQRVLSGDQGSLSADKNGLIVTFQPYEIAAYNAGVIRLSLPFALLRGVVRDRYLPEPAALGGQCFLTESDERLKRGAYARIGGGREETEETEETEAGDLLLIADGPVSHVTVSMTDASLDHGIVFYASSMNNQVLPLRADRNYVVTYTCGDTQYTLRHAAQP